MEALPTLAIPNWIDQHNRFDCKLNTRLPVNTQYSLETIEYYHERLSNQVMKQKMGKIKNSKIQGPWLVYAA